MTHKPVTEDFVPVLPWLGVLLFGLAAGNGCCACARLAERPAARAGAAAGALGRWSLSFYMLHQPVLIGLLMARGAARLMPDEHAQRFTAALWLIPGVYFLFVAAEFVVLTRLALTLTAQGASAFAVGALASAFWVGIFVASTAAHAVVQRVGHARCFLVAMATSALAVASLLPHDAYAGWLAAAAVMGLGGGLVWVSGEAWLAEAAPRERRGLLIGLFETSVGLGMLAGPALLPLSLWAGVSPLGVALVLMAAGFACAWPLLHVAEPPSTARGDGGGGETRNGWRAFAVPLAAVAAASGLMESGISSLLPSISMRLGFALDTAAWLGAFIGAGSALMQAPFGALADRIGLRRAMALAWALVLRRHAGAVGGGPARRSRCCGRWASCSAASAARSTRWWSSNWATGWWAAAWSRRWACWSPPTPPAPPAARRWAGGCSTAPGCRGWRR